MNLNYIFLCLSDKFHEIDELHKKNILYKFNYFIVSLYDFNLQKL